MKGAKHGSKCVVREGAEAGFRVMVSQPGEAPGAKPPTREKSGDACVAPARGSGGRYAGERLLGISGISAGT